MRCTMKAMDEKTDKKRIELLQVWKKGYLEAAIDTLRPKGKVLEIGFGNGVAAECIQSFKPGHHTIIESDNDLVMEARTWARNHPNVTIIAGDWEKELPKLGEFDAIFFGNYILEMDVALLKYLCPQDLTEATQEARNLVQKIETELSGMKVHFSDQQIEEFYNKVGKKNLDRLPRFFYKLKERGHITDKQYQEVTKKYHLEKDQKGNTGAIKGAAADPMLLCLEKCLAKHMHKGSKFSGFVVDPVSRYEDSQFFDKIITNPNLNYVENAVPLKLPKAFEKEKLPDATIMVIEKLK